ncbi:MAG: hypothetical protein L3J62_00290 [Gammaproteobacteria bacterium]|nr:hypothetical protein [Gammaproteobacteria bacterium]
MQTDKAPKPDNRMTESTFVIPKQLFCGDRRLLIALVGGSPTPPAE